MAATSCTGGPIDFGIIKYITNDPHCRFSKTTNKVKLISNSALKGDDRTN